jgi:NifU-like protein involved in Fe-S cluster formation
VIYGKGVHDRVAAVRYRGELDAETVRVEKTNPVCGDHLVMMIEIEAGRVKAARWRASGCPPTLAAADCLVEMIEGRDLGVATAITPEEIMARFEGFPKTSRHAAQLAVDAVREAIAVASKAK